MAREIDFSPFFSGGPRQRGMRGRHTWTRWHGWLILKGALLAVAGCASSPPIVAGHLDRATLEERAIQCLHSAIGYRDNPIVRVQAVEALQLTGAPDARPWIRSAFNDEHPAVRFAACVAVGVLQDHAGESAVRKRLADSDPNVRVAALFARHRLGHTEQTGRITSFLLDHDNPGVRRNAALVLGLLGEPTVIKVLARAMRDPDPTVRQVVLEALARSGNEEAARELSFATNSGIGSEEVLAVNALAGIRDERYADVFRYKLGSAVHVETRLAAIRGLALLGYDEAYSLALRSLRREQATGRDPRDPPEGRLLRVRQLAAAALGAIGRTDALPDLARLMEDSSDPRLRVSCAQAILDILRADEQRAMPFDRQN